MLYLLTNLPRFLRPSFLDCSRSSGASTFRARTGATPPLPAQDPLPAASMARRSSGRHGQGAGEAAGCSAAAGGGVVISPPSVQRKRCQAEIPRVHVASGLGRQPGSVTLRFQKSELNLVPQAHDMGPSGGKPVSEFPTL
jgi:hypothetical protein